jgi:fluoride exporter
MTWSLFAWVALGGALGATLRAAVAVWLASSVARGEFPWATLAVNALGTAILVMLAALALNGRALSDDLQLLVGTGFCGALTTFSTFAVEIVLLTRAGAVGTAIAYGAASLLGGLAIVLIVFRLIR